MSPDEGLNSLERFRKAPGRLVLEEYSHCEVPAGCGGVVLRWRNPFHAVPLLLHLETAGPVECFIDGVPVHTGRLDLALGRHTLALVLREADRGQGLVLLAGASPRKTADHVQVSAVREASWQLLTATDGTWKATLVEPANEAWKSPDFDDGGWTTLVSRPLPPAEPHSASGWRREECARLGAVPLGLPAVEEASGPVWIRKSFEIPPPQGPEPT